MTAKIVVVTETINGKCPDCGNDNLQLTYKTVAERHWFCWKCRNLIIMIQAGA